MLSKKTFLFLYSFFSTLLHLWAQAPCFDAVGANGLRRGCVPFTVNVTECTGGGTNLLYKYEDGTSFVPSTTYTYTKPGIYPITQVGSFAGQGDSLRKGNYIEVLPTPAPVFSVKYCSGREIALFINDNTYESYLINWGDATTQTVLRGTAEVRHVYASAAPVTVTVIGRYVPGGCGGSSAIIVNPIVSIPSPNIQQVTVISQNSLTGRVSLSFTTDVNFTYIVQQKEGAAGTYQNIINLNGTGQLFTQQITNLNTLGITYYYRLLVQDLCGNQVISGEIPTTTVQVTAQNNQNVLSWNVYQGLNFQNYQIYRDNVLLQTINSVGQNTFTDVGVQCTQRYCYSLVTNIGTTLTSISRSQEACAVAFSNDIPPSAAALFGSVSTDNKRIELQWQAPAVPTIARHIIYREKIDIGTNTVVSRDTIRLEDSKQSAVDTEVDFIKNPQIRYCYNITYQNQCGNAAPISGKICPVLLKGEIIGADKAVLEWTAYENGSAGVFDYFIEVLDINNAILQTISVSSSQSYVDNALLRYPQVVRYRIRTVAGGTGVFSYSNLVELKQKYKLFFPNAFTPNQDGLNDLFKPTGLYIKDYKLSIYNKNGQQIFTSNQFEEGWDGTWNGTLQNADVYVYVAEITDYTGQYFVSKGTFTLLK
ncbi:MAG: hypothetical protein EAZ55_12325 [Cytophagales bacterium]|nr:MAG: hypothetical protein EAZ55_12325 [Cytophagales bacterium]